MPGSIHISATQPPATPIFLQVDVGKKEYSGNIEQDGLSFPVTSLRESMVIMLYNADRELISKTELKTKTIVESGTTDVVFTLDSGEVILQLQFLLSDDDRKRIQQMRNSAMKRKQHELLGDSNEFNFPDSPLSKRLIEKISSIESKGDETKLWKNLSLNDLQDRAIFPGINVEACMKTSREDLLLQSGGKKFEDPNDYKGRAIFPGINVESCMKASREDLLLLSGEKKFEDPDGSNDRAMFPGRNVESCMKASREDLLLQSGGKKSEDRNGSKDRAIFPGINVESCMKASTEDLLLQNVSKKFEDRNGSKEGYCKPKSSRSSSAVKNMVSAFESTSLSSGRKERKKAIVPLVADKDWNYRSRLKPGENGVPNASSDESRRLGPSEARKQKVRGEHDEHELSRSKRKHRRSIGRFSLEKLRSSRNYLEYHPLNYLVATSSTWLHPHVCVTTASRQLKDALELERCLRIKHDDKSETAEKNKTGEARKTRTQLMLHLNGWWINQGVRAAIVVIACGALFLNNR